MSEWAGVLEVWTWTYYSAESSTQMGRRMQHNTYACRNPKMKNGDGDTLPIPYRHTLAPSKPKSWIRPCFELHWNNQHQVQSNLISHSLVVFHHDRISPIQYLLYIPEVVNQLVSWLLFSGYPMSVKTANDPPRDKHSLLALYHVSELWNFL